MSFVPSLQVCLLDWFAYDLPRIGLEGEIVVGPAHFIWVPFFFGGGPNCVFTLLTKKKESKKKGLGSGALTDRAEKKKKQNRERKGAGAEFTDQPHKFDHLRRSDRWIELKFSEVVPNT